MSNVPTMLTIFVMGVQGPSPNSEGADDNAMGIYYDSTRWHHYNAGGLIGDPDEPGDSVMATYVAVQSAIQNAPRHYDLIVETDNRGIASDLTDHLDRRARDRAAGRSSTTNDEIEQHEPTRRIVELVEMRTKRGDCFVEVIYSGNDPTARTGLGLAKGLALRALRDPS